MRKLIFIVLLMALISCSDKKTYLEHNYLFTFEGCKYYEVLVKKQHYLLANCSNKVYNEKQEIKE